MKKILCIFGAGGFGIEIAELSLRINQLRKRWDEICFIDDTPSKQATLINKLNVRPYDWALENSTFFQCKFVIAIGEPSSRRLIAERLVRDGFTFDTLIDPTAIVADNAVIEHGVIIPQFATVASNSHLGFNSCLNVGSVIGHGIQIGSHTALSSYAVIGGDSTIGECTYIGMGALVKEKLRIGSCVVIGMGSVVHYNIEDGLIALGNPAKVVRRNEDQKVFK